LLAYPFIRTLPGMRITLDSRLRGNDVSHSTGEKKPARRPVFRSNADYFEAAGAAAAEAASAAAEAAEAAAEAAEAAASAAAGAAGVAAASAAGAAGAAAGAVASAAGAAGVTVVSSFFEQAARATASRETISRDFFMVFP
jgi:hypothetical protein